MYAGVPRARPSEVRCPAAAVDSDTALATPKSVDQRVLPGQENVVGLDVAMDHALLVGVGERVGHFAEDPHDLLHRQLALAWPAGPGATRPR